MGARNHCAHRSYCVWLVLICTFVLVMNKMLNTQYFDVTAAAAAAAAGCAVGSDSDGFYGASVADVAVADVAVAAAVDDVPVAVVRPHILAYGCSSLSNRNAFRVVYSHRRCVHLADE